jgi:hypothetical protein
LPLEILENGFEEVPISELKNYERKITMKKIALLRFACLALLLTLVVGASTSARADYVLNVTNGFATCGPNGCGSVNISINGSGTQATFTVTSLMSGYQFDSFYFNGPSLTLITGLSYNATPPPFNADGFGGFNYLYDTGINGGSTGSNCSTDGTVSGSSAGCTFTFTLSGSGFTSSTFYSGIDVNNFAGHLANGTCTGYVGDGTNSGSGTTADCTSTPEPASLSLLVSGMIGLAGLLRTKSRKA